MTYVNVAGIYEVSLAVWVTFNWHQYNPVVVICIQRFYKPHLIALEILYLHTVILANLLSSIVSGSVPIVVG